MVHPKEFIQTHMPFDPLWQLLQHPISHKEFRQGISHSKLDTTIFYYEDSVAGFLQLDTLQQLQAAARRMKKAGIDNDDLRTWLAYNEMKITILNQEEDMNTFNVAVADLNKAKALLNNFIQYRNNNFQPPRPIAEIEMQFVTIDKLLLSSDKKIKVIGLKTENYQYDTEGLQKNLEDVMLKVQQQKACIHL